MSHENHKKLTYTVDDAIEKIGFGLFQVILTLVCSLIWLADAMQYITLHILPFLVRCQWELSSVEVALTAMILPIGELVGSVLWGLLADGFGRKKTVIGVLTVMLLFGILSAVKITDKKLPEFPWLLFCRFGFGIGTAGINQSTTYYIEFIPKKVRGICSAFVLGWFTVGSIFGVVCALVTVEYLMLGWHWYLAVINFPLVFVLISFSFLPESARYYLSKGRQHKALNVLMKISRFNCTSLPEGELDVMEAAYVATQETAEGTSLTELNVPNSNENHSPTENHHLLEDDTEKHETFKRKILLLFTDGMWKVTAILSVQWAGTVFIYVGNLLLTSTMLPYDHHCGHSRQGENSTTMTCADSNLNSQDYQKIIYTNFAELPGLFLTLLLIEVIGRKLTLALILLLTMLGFSLLFICTGPVLLTAFLFLTRAFALNTMRIVYVYTSEVYPTSVRGLGTGVMSFIERIGEALAPFISQVLFSVSDYAAIGTYAGISLVLAILALLLPIETKQRSL